MMGMALSNYGTMSRAERNRTRLRVANAVRAHAQAGRWLGGRPPYGYLIADHGPHSNPSKAASGARLHQLAPDPVTAPVVQRIYDSYLAGAGYKQIATALTNEAVPSPSAHDRSRNSHRSGHAWAMSAVRSILANPRYLGYHVSGRTKKADILLDPDVPALGHVTQQQWQDRADLAEGPWCDLDAFHADAVSALWELTTRWSGTNRPYAAGDLLSGVRTRLRTLQATERRHRCRQSGTPDPLDTVSASIGRTGEELLAAAIVDATGHGLTIADAAVLYATRVLGMSLAEVADIAEVPAGHLRRQRRSAIDRLVA